MSIKIIKQSAANTAKAMPLKIVALPNHLQIIQIALLIAACLSPHANACPCSDIPKPKAQAEQLNQQAGLSFSHTSAYNEEFNAAIKEAKIALQSHLGQQDAAIVADIDETLLDNRPYFATHPQINWDHFSQWIKQSVAPSLKPTANLLAWARERGFAVFLITGRPESDRRYTIENLVKEHIAYDGLFMRADGDTGPAETIKTAHRQTLEQMGFKIIVNIGDQYSDLYGGNAEDCEKLPNRMYYIP